MNIVPRRVYSQGQQDGIIESIFKQIGTTNRFCVEFGFDSATLTGGGGSNVARLVIEDGWRSVMFDARFENLDINLQRVLLTPDTIGDVFSQHGVPLAPDYVSIDVDSVDLWLMRALLHQGYRPRLISVEYNSNFDLQTSVTVRPGTTWQHYDRVYGASLLALRRCAAEFDYELVAVEPTLDAFFVDGYLATDPPAFESFAGCTNLPTHVAPSAERFACFEPYPKE